MPETPTWRQTLSRIVLGLLLALCVYFVVESLGLGSSRKQRDIQFLLPQQPTTQIEVTYILAQETQRIATHPTPQRAVLDQAMLPPGDYELRIILRDGNDTTIIDKKLSLNDETEVVVDLRRE